MNSQFITPITSIQVAGFKNVSAPWALNAQIPFKDVFESAYSDMISTSEVSARDAEALVMGTNDDLHTIMINAAAETAAIETVVELSARAVSAYKEIMQMQI